MQSVANYAPELEDIGQTLRQIEQSLGSAPARSNRFVASVVALTADRASARVRLCTGKLLDVPLSLIKSVRNLGQTASGEEQAALVAAEFDTSTAAGRFVADLAAELERLTRSLVPPAEGGRRSLFTDQQLVHGKAGKPAPTLKPEPTDTRIGRSLYKVSSAPVIVPSTAYLSWRAPPGQYLALESSEAPEFTQLNCIIEEVDPSYMELRGGFVINGYSIFARQPPGIPYGQVWTANIFIEATLNQATT
ncbi:MAG TPA: hypothetical protein VMI54_01120 [Polyangiaceae bacterium]|nr:hypothetical protein [Polyangiaceae bacterium]